MSGPAEPHDLGGDPGPPLRRPLPAHASRPETPARGSVVARSSSCSRSRWERSWSPRPRSRCSSRRPNRRRPASRARIRRSAATRRGQLRHARRAGPGTGRTPPAAPGPVGIRAGTPWRSSELGYEFEYSDWWKVDSSDGRTADLVFEGEGDAELIVAGVRASRGEPGGVCGPLVRRAPEVRPGHHDGQPGEEREPGPGHRVRGWHRPDVRRVEERRVRATSPIGFSLMNATDGRTTVAISSSCGFPKRPPTAHGSSTSCEVGPSSASRPSGGNRESRPSIPAWPSRHSASPPSPSE